MYYYIDTIEQVKKKNEQGQVIEGINEYGNREICKTKDKDDNIIPMTLDQTRSKYYKKLSDVSNDLVSIDDTKSHFYMDIRIVNSKGGIEEKDTIGQYVEG